MKEIQNTCLLRAERREMKLALDESRKRFKEGEGYEFCDRDPTSSIC